VIHTFSPLAFQQFLFVVLFDQPIRFRGGYAKFSDAPPASISGRVGCIDEMI
jgi:hypothetical protein